MYTQCPECSTAFRVTAALLQQASGRVRCGSCGHAFNALEQLSEDPPSAGDAEAADDGGEASIDTYTDLSAFDDVRIEDTGVEWRVVDDEEPPGGDDENEPGLVSGYPAEDEPAARDFGAGAAADGEDAAADYPGPEDGTGGILVEESGIRPPQETLDLARAGGDEPRYDDNTPLPEDFGEAPQPPQRRASDLIEPRSPEFDERQEDLALGEPEDWRELLDEFRYTDPDDRAGPGEEAADFDPGPDAGPGEAAGVDFDPGSDDTAEVDFAVEAENGAGFAAAVDFDPGEPDGRDDAPFAGDEADAREDAAAAAEERARRERVAAFEAELSAAYAPEDDDAAGGGDSAGGPALPPPTEEEMTADLQIDRDLLRLAAEEDLTATGSGAWKFPADSLLVETIVMEGDIVRSALDKELDAAVETAAAAGGPRALLDTYVKSPDRLRGGRRRTDPPGRAVIAGVAVLAFALVLQVVHAWRHDLATYGAFNHTAGPVYRLLGDPLVPAWNVRGWRFESTRGSTDASDEVLTIRSEITNASSQALPYPLLHVALTDRFEEIIGSRVLAPADYLGNDGDATALVAPGTGFTAVITVEALSREATGFKLNVCYREDAERLRCATEDFLN